MILEIWAKFLVIFPELFDAPCLPVKFDKRFKKIAGRMEWDAGRIMLSPSLFAKNPKKYELEVIPHEVAHYVDYLLHGPHYLEDEPTNDKLHGPTWQAIMCAYGLSPDTVYYF